MNENLLDQFTTFTVDFESEGLVRVGAMLLLVIVLGSFAHFKIKKGIG